MTDSSHVLVMLACDISSAGRGGRQADRRQAEEEDYF